VNNACKNTTLSERLIEHYHNIQQRTIINSTNQWKQNTHITYHIPTRADSSLSSVHVPPEHMANSYLQTKPTHHKLRNKIHSKPTYNTKSEANDVTSRKHGLALITSHNAKQIYMMEIS